MLIKKLISAFNNLMIQPLNKFKSGQYFIENLLKSSISRTTSISHNNVKLTFSVPNRINQFRADTFSTKEPETLEWIDQIPENSIVWDIGANVGLYSCYAAKRCGCMVYAFEPSVFNLEILARNIYLNGLTDKIVIIPLPLNEKVNTSKLNLSTTDWGGALSTFGQSYGHDGKPLHKIFEYQTIGVSMVDAIRLLKIPQPDYIKIDVDGIEHLILKGGKDVLKSIKGILIEINEEFQKQFEDCEKYLHESGLILKEKRHADMFKNTICYNQIWHRPAA